MAREIPRDVDTVIVGTGPSALILSYILHGNIPYYAGGHHDTILCAKLEKRPCLLDLTPDLYEHFYSSLRYSTQALPINTLLDTLLRPNADTEANPTSTVQWRYEPKRAVPHLVLGNSPCPGGQWAANPVPTSWEIGTLSYAEMLSLPGYSYAEHYMAQYGRDLPEFVRPSRREAAAYYAAYPTAVGISDNLHFSEQVDGVERVGSGFFIQSHRISCKHIVLASGTSSINIPPPPSLKPLQTIQNVNEPLLVIGSGFSAADSILSAPSNRKVFHIYRWSPDERPSPLRNCHYQAYPEYASVYRQMRFAASKKTQMKGPQSPSVRRRSSVGFGVRDWTTVYHGLPNAEVVNAFIRDGSAVARIRTSSGQIIETRVGGLAYVVGRRGLLDYLSPALRTEVLGEGTEKDASTTNSLVSGRTLRSKAEMDTEVAPHVFITGALAGDSLVRHAFGTCAYAGGRIISDFEAQSSPLRDSVNGKLSKSSSIPSSRGSTPPSRDSMVSNTGTTHEDLHLDRRKLLRLGEGGGRG